MPTSSRVKSLQLIALMLLSIGIPFGQLALSPLFATVMPLNDVLLYGWWLQEMQLGKPVFGIAQPFVYPYPSLVPMWLASFIGGASGILVGWCLLVGVLNALAVGSLTKWGRGATSSFLAAWTWLGFLWLLGPSAIGRIDAISVAVAILGLVAFKEGKIFKAVAFFTMGAWLKIWPVALALGAFIADKAKRQALVAGSSIVAVVLVVAAVAGANSSLFSFVSTQGNRGIQIESPIATFWLWAAKLGADDSKAGIYYDEKIITNQVYGPLVSEISSLMTAVMLIAIAITALLAFKALKAGASRNQIFVITSMTAVLDLIVFNKVGSPQFMAWLALPLIALILFEIKKIAMPVAGFCAIALLTNLVYPISYMDLMGLGDVSVTLLTLRNLLLVLMLIWANLRLGSLPKRL